MLTTRYTLFCISKRRIPLRLAKIMLVTSHRDVIAAFMARRLFLAINLEIFCNLYTEKCENNALENSDTFDGLLCDFLF